MRFLIDTNILLPLEPVLRQGITHDAPPSLELARIVQESGNQFVVHPAVAVDIDRDTDVDRRELRKHLLAKYPKLADPPPITSSHEALIGSAAVGTNDWVDNHLLVAVERHAVDYLVTQDQGIHRRAIRLGISERVLTVADALSMLRALFDTTPAPPPAVRQIALHNVDERDPIFDGFRDDYPGFDAWLKRAKLGGRQAWTIDVAGRLAGICIVKREDDSSYGLVGKVLKICSFKVADEFLGAKFGELLLKTVFVFAYQNKFDWLYVTAFEKHALLLRLLDDFGFSIHPQTSDLGELVLVKPSRPEQGSAESLGPLGFAIRYGPCALDWLGAQGWIVPIQPRFMALLFPELEQQASLFAGYHAFGNSIGKAYLCHSPAKHLAPGELLAFYRSQDQQAIAALGIVEQVIRCKDPAEVGRFVARRTVYPMGEIERMCAEDEVLAIRFRQILLEFTPVTLAELVEARVLKAAPQSLTRISSERMQWLQHRIEP